MVKEELRIFGVVSQQSTSFIIYLTHLFNVETRPLV